MTTKLLQGDCLELMQGIPDKSIDMILCDLPYGLTKCSWDVPIDLQRMWAEYERIARDRCAILLFAIQPFATDLINSNRKLFRYEIVWEKTQKTGFLNANRMPLRGHENIYVFYKRLPVYNPQKYTVARNDIGRVRTRGDDRCALYDEIRRKNYEETGMRYPHDVIRFSNWNGSCFGNTIKGNTHQTQKPVPLLEYLIKTYSNEGDVVLDNCMGSGSTGVACVNLRRDFIGIELDGDFFRAAKERIESAKEADNG